MKELVAGKERLDLGQQIIIFIGPEGSGKTSIAQKLSDETGKPYITTGGLIRDLRDNDKGPLGDACRDMFANNTYLDGDKLLQIMVNRLKKEDVNNGFILDGGLRTVHETADFQKMLNMANRKMPLTIVYLDIPIWTSFDRLVTGENARKRVDGKGSGDTKEGVAKRLSQFYYRLEERLEIVKKEPNWKLIKIDATKNSEKVLSDTRNELITAPRLSNLC